MAKITYEDKVALIDNPSIDKINKATADDFNEIKNAVNANDDTINSIKNENGGIKATSDGIYVNDIRVIWWE